MATKAQIALAHIAAAGAGWSEEERKRILRELGVDSSVKLSSRQLDEYLRRAKADGWFPASRTTRTAPKLSDQDTSRDKLLRKIGALLRDLDYSWSYANGISRRMFGVDDVGWLDAEQLHSVVSALVKHQEKVKSERLKVNGE